MKKLYARFQTYKMDVEGATAIEYGLIAAGISLAIVAIVFTFGTDLKAVFTNMDTQIKAAPTG
jgi:pilus assembly protein Flp/PilA